MSACGFGSADFQALRLNTFPWQNGEVSTYRITDQSGAVAGQMLFTVSALDETTSPEGGWLISREIRGQLLESVQITTTNRLRPQKSLLVRTYQDGQEQVEATYSGSNVDLLLATKRNVITNERNSIPSDSYDFRSVLLLLRALPLDAKYATQLNTYLPIAGLQNRVEVVVAGPESIDVEAGTFQTWRVNLRTQTNRGQAWIAQEAPFALIKFVDGPDGNTFELLNFDP